MRKPLVIGIAGGSASGKSVLAKHLKEAFEDLRSVRIIKLDDYYNDQSHLSMDQRVKTNYDHPFAFDWKLMNHQLELLISGQGIDKPIYDFMNHTRAKETEHLDFAEVIILEGLFILEEEELRAKCDIKLFVDTPADIRFIRRLKRDVKDRGRTLESVVEQYIETVRVMHDQFIEVSKKYADLIIPEGGHNKVALDLLITKISSILK